MGTSSAGDEELNNQLVIRLRAGDETALDALIQLYHPSLTAFVQRYVGSADAAEDILQDVFVRFWHSRKNLRSDISIKGYLYTAARNAALNSITSESARRNREEDFAADYRGFISSDFTAAADVEEEELAAVIQRAIAELPARCHEIFILNREHGLSYPEIANMLGISTGTVKTQMSRAVATLAGKLAPFLAVMLAVR